MAVELHRHIRGMKEVKKRRSGYESTGVLSM
jgi:hypothetical protein